MALTLTSRKKQFATAHVLSEDLLAWSYRLGKEIHNNAVIAGKTVEEAMDEFRRSAKINERREKRSLIAREHRNKLTLNQPALFQRCFYAASEKSEMIQEREYWKGDSELTQRNLLIRFVEKLVLIGLEHNSFFMAEAMFQVLHNYGISAAMAAYFALVQYEYADRTDSTFRRSKIRIMDLLEERFNTEHGNFLSINDGPRNSRRYEGADATDDDHELVEQWLGKLMPILPQADFPRQCVMPVSRRNVEKANSSVGSDGSDRTNQFPKLEIPELQFNSSIPDDEHKIELLRIHALLHISCLAGLIDALGLPPARQKRSIPNFNLLKDGGDHKMSLNEQSSGLTSVTDDDLEAELEAIRQHAERRADERRAVHSRLLAIEVNGRALTDNFDTYSDRSVRIKVDDSARKIELNGRKGNKRISLAIHWLQWGYHQRATRVEKSSVVLEGGQRFDFTVSYKETLEGEIADIEIEYNEEKRLRAMILALARLRYKRREVPVDISTEPSGLAPAFIGFLFVVVLAATFLINLMGRRPSSMTNKMVDDKPKLSAQGGQEEPSPSPPNSQNHSDRKQNDSVAIDNNSANKNAGRDDQPLVRPTVQGLDMNKHPQPEAVTASRQENRKLENTPEKKRNDDSAELNPETAVNPGQESPVIPDNGVTRALDPEAVQLSNVKSIYIDRSSFGDGSIAQTSYEALVGPDGIQSRNRFSLARATSDADAVLRGAISKVSDGWQISIRLVNKRGEKIWREHSVIVKGNSERENISEAIQTLVDTLISEVNGTKEK